ncbi:hypothetical protein ACE939_10955 [Aquimarina sp. W85]|uniref:hypothetical protein n=1 Tax=Aquimarina rhodophyticola TaxID=3342246 RepID=UPI0036722EC3
MIAQNKIILLILGLLLAYVLAYQFAISNTVALYTDNKMLNNDLQLAQESNVKYTTLKKKEQELNSILTTNNIDEHAIQNSLLKTLNYISKDIKFNIQKFEEPHSHQDTETKEVTTTYNFTLEGDYSSLIQVVYLLEQSYSFGNIAHINFTKIKDYRTNKSSLHCKILLQKIN